jgi:hypothetical protein
MQFRTLQFVLLIALAAGVCAEPAFAQRGARQGKKGSDREEQRPAKRQDDRGDTFRPGKAGRGREGMPAQWMERLRQMTPEQQERFLRNNDRIRNLPPERQAEIRENLRRWNSLSPEERREMMRRDETWRSMTPEQRRRVREEIMPRWQQLPPERRQALQRRLGALARLDDAERERRLNDERFLVGLSVEDRDLLRELAKLRLGPAAPPPPEQ